MNPEVTKLNSLSGRISENHKHVLISELNSKYAVTLAVNDETYPWHNHPNSDELLLVLEGTLIIEIRHGETFVLKDHDAVTIPAGLEHRTIPQGRVVNLVVEDIGTQTIFTDKNKDS